MRTLEVTINTHIYINYIFMHVSVNHGSSFSSRLC